MEKHNENRELSELSTSLTLLTIQLNCQSS